MAWSVFICLFALGGLSAAFANAFLNPLHIIRIRLSAFKESKEESM